MEFDFEALKDKAVGLAKTGAAKTKELTDAGVAKAKQLTEIAKLKFQISSENDAIRKACLEIGKLYFAERGSAPEPPYAELCQKIAASKAKIEYNNERIADIKTAGNLSDQDVQDVEDEPAPAEENADDSEPEA